MNRIDEIWFFMGKAISYNKKDNRKFYFDKKNDKLFSLDHLDKMIMPCYRNEHVISPEENKKYLELIISSFNEYSFLDYIFEVPRISFTQKKEVLIQFVEELNDLGLKEKLNAELSLFEEYDDFDFKYNLREVNFELYAKFDMFKGRFVAKKSKEIMDSLGIKVNTPVIW